MTTSTTLGYYRPKVALFLKHMGSSNAWPIWPRFYGGSSESWTLCLIRVIVTSNKHVSSSVTTYSEVIPLEEYLPSQREQFTCQAAFLESGPCDLARAPWNDYIVANPRSLQAIWMTLVFCGYRGSEILHKIKIETKDFVGFSLGLEYSTQSGITGLPPALCFRDSGIGSRRIWRS